VFVLGGLIASIDGQGFSPQSWLSYSLFLALGTGLLFASLRVASADKRATQATLLAFLLRLGVGFSLTLLLPNFGYANSDEHQAGYMFTDAFLRDRAAWSLADSESPIWTAFQGDYTEDQYGGMLALSATIYRLFSPDAHRPMLILILTAAIGALGVPYLWRATRDWFNGTVAVAAAWIFALYPEAILLSSSQMREPFIISGMAVAFFGLTQLKEGKSRRSAWIVANGLVMLIISPPSALVTFVLLFGAWWLDANRRVSWKQVGIFLSLLLVGVVIVVSVFGQSQFIGATNPLSVLIEWFVDNFDYQTFLGMRASGWMQKLFRETGEAWEPLIVLVSGFSRPRLPAHLVIPSASWIVRLIGILRSAGWYLLAPFLIYGITRAFRATKDERRSQLLWLFFFIWGAMIAAALVAGGDQWDNPRYRTWFIAWEATLVAWAWWWARSRRDAWIFRWLAIEGLFVLLFAEWYVSRYYQVISRLPFWSMVAVILLASVLILLGGWLTDRKRVPISNVDPPEPRRLP
jgi:hypothetical protein